MSLYDGIDNKEGGDTASDVVSGWSSAYKLLHSQLQAKKVSLMQTKRQKQTTVMAPVVDLKRHADLTDQPLHFNQLTGRLERGPPASLGNSPFIASEPIPSLTGVADEYEPLRPNEYEEIVKKRREQRQKERDEEKVKKDQDRDETMSRPNNRPEPSTPSASAVLPGGTDPGSEMDQARRRREEENEIEEEYEKPKRSNTGAAIAPPMSLIEEDTAAKEETTEAGSSSMDMAQTSPPPLGFSIGLGGSVASKIMAKYGYKEGQGLGKQEQGMSTALFVEKTSKRGGKIIHEKDLPKEPPREVCMTNANLLKNPSKVILLRNMVGSGEVDDDLEPETAEECAKYGKVIKCVIFEIPGVCDEEAVRIFVEFERVESATKAVVDINGRYFGGRVVKAGFYNLDRFRRYDLAEEQDF